MGKKFFILLLVLLMAMVALTACPDKGLPSPTTTPSPEAKPAPSTTPTTEPEPAPGTTPTTEPEPAPGTTPTTEPEPATTPAPGTTPTTEPKTVPEEGDRNEVPREDVWLLNELNYGLEMIIGQRVWALGIFGDARISGDGLAFLVENFESLLSDEELEEHTFARLRGELPGNDMSGAEVLVYGEVQDYAKAMNDPESPPVPLITVEKYEIINPPKDLEEWENPFEFIVAFFKKLFTPSVAIADEAAPAGNQATPNDRAVVLSGGINAHNNHARYKDNVILKYNRLRQLGFTPEQIGVIYADGAAINVGGTNIVDKAATSGNISDIIKKYLEDMPASSTLAIFVTDHGTGYNEQKGWRGARPADSGVDATSGKLYDENTFKVDLKRKVWQKSDDFVVNGKTFRVWRNQAGKVELWMRQGGSWVKKGTDENGTGFISEWEIGEDLNGNGVRQRDFGWEAETLAGLVGGDKVIVDNKWDTDRDGEKDVRARWDGNRFVFERKNAAGNWVEIGRDTNGDYVIDGADGGVDWNMDGDKNDKVGFHEGINLWGRAVLWDDAMADMLKPLKDKGIHILVEAITCYGGGLIGNLQGIAENVVAGSNEDTTHTNRLRADGTVYAADQKAFMENLNGIDIDCFNVAWQAGVAADNAAADAAGHRRNNFNQWQTPLIATASTFENFEGRIGFTLKIPDSLAGKVHDFEVIYGLQVPPWDSSSLDDDIRGMRPNLPEGYHVEGAPGGFRIYTDEPMSQIPSLWDLGYRPGTTKLRIYFTNNLHLSIGYLSPTQIELPIVDDVIGAEVDATVEAFDEEATTGMMLVYYAGTDLTGGDVPIRRVQLYINGEEVHDSGNLRETQYTGQPWPRMVEAGETYTLELVVTNDHGQQRRVTQTVTVTGPADPVFIWIPCFAEDTLVLMADNSLKRISEIQAGEMVKTYDTETGEILITDVVGTSSGEADYYYLINGDLKVTPPHPFFTAEGQWVRIADLKVGDKIRSVQGLVEIASIERVNSGQRICNISVRDYHNFFVSANGKDFYLVREGP